MSNGVNMGSKVSSNQEFLREIALNSYGYGSKSGEAGGRGNIGLVTKEGKTRVVKFNTSWFTSTPKVGTEAYKASLKASNSLRILLADIAQTSDLPEKTLKDIRKKLGVDDDNKPLGNSPLLTRKVTAAVVKMIDKDIWARVKAGSKEGDYGTKQQGWSADEKSFAAMSVRDASFGGTAVALSNVNSAERKIASKMANIAEKAVERAQKDRDKAVGFGIIRTFEDAVQDAAAELKKKHYENRDILNKFNGKEDGFLELAALANGKWCKNAAVRDAFAKIRTMESNDPHKAGLMRKTLANLLVSSVIRGTNLADVKEADIDTARKEAEGLLPKEKTDDYDNIDTINSLSKTVCDPSTAPEAFSRAFTTPRQREDAVAILKRLDHNGGWKGKMFYRTGLAFPLIQKAVTEARKFQPDDKPLTEEAIYAALVGKSQADNGGKDLFEAVDERVANDFAPFALSGVLDGENDLAAEAQSYVFSASASGLKYDAILESLHHPGRLPTAHDFYDASIRPMRLTDRNEYDQKINRYGEFASRRVASRYYFKGPGDLQPNLILDSQDYYGVNYSVGSAPAEQGANETDELMRKFKGKKISQMVTDMLTQHVGQPFIDSMFGRDLRYKAFNKGTQKYRRDFRNFSDFKFSEVGDKEKPCYKLVVTPNREYLKNSGLVGKDIDYELEFLIDQNGNAWVTKQWFGTYKDGKKA